MVRRVLIGSIAVVAAVLVPISASAAPIAGGLAEISGSAIVDVITPILLIVSLLAICLGAGVLVSSRPRGD